MTRNKAQGNSTSPMENGFKECFRRILPMAQASSIQPAVRPSKASGLTTVYNSAQTDLSYFKEKHFHSSTRLFVQGRSYGNSKVCVGGSY
jgi:hypothetical protein